MPEEIKGIIRIAGADMKGQRQLFTSIQKIKGVGPSVANAVCKVTGLSPRKKVGTLSNQEVKKIEDILSNPTKFGIPVWMVNRNRDLESGADKHIIGPDLTFARRQDIKRMIDIRTYRGVRHMLGLPVRGQRTKSSFRKGRTVGVVRKKSQPARKKKGGKK